MACRIEHHEKGKTLYPALAYKEQEAEKHRIGRAGYKVQGRDILTGSGVQMDHQSGKASK